MSEQRFTFLHFINRKSAAPEARLLITEPGLIQALITMSQRPGYGWSIYGRDALLELGKHGELNLLQQSGIADPLPP